ncbi:cell envelope integrity TolA C-terminal domain-containing protein [Leclercia adecarboxylata]|uniref:cell envelope integrity TolA C-terminal domain-containing protein n=1 Tax=Leclercia adecarboxylata TaxID=83655 RepID=UPI002B27D215|nr:cell envelope integrity TolA C-terminal domain-containing protein [Leclercia adecarboxylata]WNY88248.1 tolA family protein [Leclercia adecarboxylata]
MPGKMFMLAVVVSLAAGCAPLQPSGCHKTSALGSCSSGRWDDQDEWGSQARGIKAAIEDEIAEPERWKGKKCRLHMEFAQDSRALKVSTSDGDKEYCGALKVAAQKATFPAFSNPEVYRDFQKVGFDMRG